MRFRALLALAAAFIIFATQAFAAEPPRVRDLAHGKRPAMAADPRGRLHLVFEGHAKGSKVIDILYSQSSDRGLHWSEPRNISQTSGTSSDPVIAVEQGGGIDVAWCDTTSGRTHPDIYFTRSADGGKSWSKAADVSETPGISSQPALATGPDNSIHIVWVDTSADSDSPDVWYASSKDGEAFTKPLDISLTPGISNQPTVAVSPDGLAHVAWVDTSSGKEKPNVFYARTTKNGTWTGASNMSNSRGATSHPRIVCGIRGQIYLTWTDYSKKKKAPDIFLAVSSDGGAFSEARNLSMTTGFSVEPAIATDSAGRVVEVWTDSSHGSTSPDIWGAWSKDGGQSFSRAVNLSATPGVSKLASVALSSEKMYVVWEEVKGKTSVLKFTSIRLQ